MPGAGWVSLKSFTIQAGLLSIFQTANLLKSGTRCGLVRITVSPPRVHAKGSEVWPLTRRFQPPLLVQTCSVAKRKVSVRPHLVTTWKMRGTGWG